MDIAGLSMAMASNNLQTKVGTAVLSKAMDTQMRRLLLRLNCQVNISLTDFCRIKLLT